MLLLFFVIFLFFSFRLDEHECCRHDTDNLFVLALVFFSLKSCYSFDWLYLFALPINMQYFLIVMILKKKRNRQKENVQSIWNKCIGHIKVLKYFCTDSRSANDAMLSRATVPIYNVLHTHSCSRTNQQDAVRHGGTIIILVLLLRVSTLVERLSVFVRTKRNKQGQR